MNHPDLKLINKLKIELSNPITRSIMHLKSFFYNLQRLVSYGNEAEGAPKGVCTYKMYNYRQNSSRQLNIHELQLKIPVKFKIRKIFTAGSLINLPLRILRISKTKGRKTQVVDTLRIELRFNIK